MRSPGVGIHRKSACDARLYANIRKPSVAAAINE